MRDHNHISVTGHVGRGREGKEAVQLRVTPNGQSVAEFSLATNRAIKDDREPTGWREETEWFSVICWGDLSERVAETLVTGYRVLVDGRLQTRTWTDREGHPRLTVEIVASDVLLLSSRTDRERADERRALIDMPERDDTESATEDTRQTDAN